MAQVLNLQTVGSIFLLEVDADPASGMGTLLPNGDDAGIGSIAFLSVGAQGQAYLKTSSGATNWKPVDLSENDWSLAGNLLTGPMPSMPNEFIGSQNEYDVVFVRNGFQAMRLADGGNGPSLVQNDNVVGDEWYRLKTNASRNISRHVSIYTPSAYNTWHRELYGYAQTTGTTPANLLTVAIPEDSVARINAEILVKSGAGGSLNRVSSYGRIVTARNVAGALSIRQTSSNQSHEDDSALQLDIVASGNNIIFSAVGIASRTHDWICQASQLFIKTT